VSIQAVGWALKQNVSSSGAKFVLVALANYADEEGRCWPSQKQLAADTCQGERTVRRHLDTLEREGFIKREHRNRPDGTYASDVYLIQWNPAANLADGQNDRRPISTDPAANLAGHEPSIEPSIETTTTTAGADEREEAKRAMWADAREAAERIEHPTRRRAFEASLRGLIEGDDYAAWRDQNGDQIPWSDRPRLLRMAIDRFLAGEARDVRFVLDRFVIPQQYDPFPRRKAEDRRAERAPIPAAPVAPGDIIRALEIGGAWLATEASRSAGLWKIKQDDPALWARAGPILERMNLTALWASYENRSKAPRKFEDDVRYAIEDAAQRLRDAG